MQLERAAGVLLHITSLPSRYGIGDLGESAYKFIDFLAAGGQTLWQVLPLNPVGYGESPYQAFSAFAGNHLLIDPTGLCRQGLLTPADLAQISGQDPASVNFPEVIPSKNGILQKAYHRFKLSPPPPAYHNFLRENSYWLPDYALFMALKEHFGGLPWQEWEEALVIRDERKLAEYRQKLESQVELHLFLQYAFREQWQSMRSYASSRGIRIIGDLPIFMAADSSDTWVRPELFELDSGGRPLTVAGVPPDYFSKTGQRWGNPLYRWDKMEQDEYHWWRERISHLLKAVHYVRVDHFRGFEAYWEIPGTEDTAINGRWVKGPGAEFFAVLEKYFGKLPLIAEDLGYITPEVHALKAAFEFPGMKVLQFLTEEKLAERPLTENMVYYTGTHDNDTLLGWYREKVQSLLDRPTDDHNICWKFIEILYKSNAAWVVVPLQDILGLGSEARMNTPGTLGGNWRWRLVPEMLTAEAAGKLASLTRKYCR